MLEVSTMEKTGKSILICVTFFNLKAFTILVYLFKTLLSCVILKIRNFIFLKGK